MAKLYTVTEYDVITSNPEYSNTSGYKVIPEPTFSKLKEFIYEFVGSKEHADASDFFRMYKPKNRSLGDIVISVNNYVGLIQLKNGQQIQIFPKIDFDGNIRDTFLKMLKCLKDFPGRNAADASLATDKTNLYEIFIGMYVQECRNLVKKGIKSSYINVEDNSNYYKGKLLVSQHIRKNLTHKERFYISYDEFLPDRAENRLIKSTLLKLQNITGSAKTSKDIRQLLTAFEMINPSVNYEKDFSKIVTNRNTKDYEMLMKWSKVFLFNKSFSTFSGKTVSRAILFPMEKLYESYVGAQMRKAFGPEGWKVSEQDKGYYLFDELKGENNSRSIFRVRPDIVMRRGEQIVVLDTKWKRLVSERSKNYGISQADMYQMYAYGKKYTTDDFRPEVWLLYPKTTDMIEPLLFKSDDGITVHAFFVDVPNIKESLKALRKMVYDSLEYGALQNP